MKNFIKAVLPTLFIFSICLRLNAQHNPYIIKPLHKPLNIAHAGGQNLAPTNNMLAYNVSDSIGVDMLEMDVLLTKDNVLVLHHNETINSKTEGNGYVKDYTLEELRQFNYGYNFKDTSGNYPYRNKHVQITTLEEILSRFADKYSMCIEIKNTDDVLGKEASEELYRLLEKYNASNKVIVSCFDDKTLNYFKKISGGKVPVSSATKKTRNFIICQKLHLLFFYKKGDCALQIPVTSGKLNLATKRIIEQAHKKNLAVHYWTINDANEMKRLIQLGADGILTDRPDIMKKVLEEMK